MFIFKRFAFKIEVKFGSDEKTQTEYNFNNLW